MKAIKIIFIFGLLLNIHNISAQNFAYDLTIPVTVNGTLLDNAWAGGLNNPQFSAIDLDGDGLKDLFVFDPFLERVTTYINFGTSNQVDYHYAPQYISKFPRMHGWVILADYNCDSREDIFTYSYYGGAALYENVSAPGNLQFTLKDTLILSNYSGISANLYIQNNDLPAFSDIDGDGDLDILTLSYPGNGGIQFHKNYAMENFGICDTLLFMLEPYIWGGILLSGGSSVSDNLLAFDSNGDGDKDILTDEIISGVSGYNNLLYYKNDGNASNAILSLADDSFPSYNIPAYVRLYPAAFYFDANNDGKNDLIVSPQQNNISENVHNAYLYQDTSLTANCGFKMIQDDFLVGDMLDVGSGANTRFFDVDDDGLQDIVIGNYQKREKDGDDSSSLWYFRNTGTATNPGFQLITDNFVNTMTNTQYGMAPEFGDVDGDFDADLLVGLSNGTISKYTNNAGSFVLDSANYNGIDVGMFCTPYLFDLNQDGRTDLICGNRNGKLSYFENTGTGAVPIFTLMNSFWGHVNVTDTLNNIYGNSYPFLYFNNGNLELLVGSLRGHIYRYGNITGNLNGAFSLLDTIFGGIYEPTNITVDGADLNADGLMDLLTGNYAGGMTLYKRLPLSINEPISDKSEFEIFPNPAGNTLTIKLKEEIEISILNALGEELINKKIAKGNSDVDVSSLSSGIYFIKSDHTARKFIKL